MPVIVPSVIKRGDPVGVLYKTDINQVPCNNIKLNPDCKYSINQGSCFCVHNGVFYSALYRKNNVFTTHSSTNPNFGTLVQVTLRHWKWPKGAAQPCLENLPIPRVAEVRKTQPIPSAASLNCKKHPPASGNPIVRGTPVGVSFDEGSGLDVKNGVFLYWRNNSGTRYCKYYQSDKPFAIVYLHWIVAKNGNGVALRLRRKRRTGVIHVFRVPTTANPPHFCK